MAVTITDNPSLKPEYIQQLEKDFVQFIKKRIGKKGGKDKKYACILYVVEEEKTNAKQGQITVCSNQVSVTNISFKDPHYLVDSARRVMWKLIQDMF